MKPAQKPTTARKAPKKKVTPEVVITPELNGKYDDQPLFQDKVNRANHILKTFGIPKFS
jgi:hypothetical protein